MHNSHSMKDVSSSQPQCVKMIISLPPATIQSCLGGNMPRSKGKQLEEKTSVVQYREFRGQFLALNAASDDREEEARREFTNRPWGQSCIGSCRPRHLQL